ncbi:MAG: M20/M25/M40 family metallo-hydrolase [Gammaproteobacteria bacterium]|nr:M20/M25/M40 family metallo-hydrolase [Gammaproteobacteria bacterium]
MSSRLIFLLVFTLLFCNVANATIHHQLKVTVDPAKSFISVRDTLTLPDNIADESDSLEFLLHHDLTIDANDNIEKLVTDNSPKHLSHYRVNVIPDDRKITLAYSGTINHDLQQPSEESARSFSSTLGIIDEVGVFLDGSAAWYPYIANSLVNFDLDISMPAPWVAVSAGEKTTLRSDDKLNRINWEENSPQDDIYLVAARFKLYRQQAGNVEVQVYLREDDPSLAQQYLDTGAQYLTMYQKFFGKYPYQKFAAIENFWETGFGMPSFTLLGPKVMRFPFILHGSYPHEILHNWWGNGVFVDYQSGNWAEGLTAYLADHLIAEQRGNAVNYRRNNLQKYTDYVDSGRDFPLSQFRSRHDSASEAVGYGKALMLFHMLRIKLGDDTFSNGLRLLYKKHKFKKANFDDLKNIFSQVSEQDLGEYFTQWVDRSGAPSLKLSKVETIDNKLTIEIEQTQNDQPYTMAVPVIVEFSDGHSENLSVSLDSKKNSVSISTSATPTRVAVDSEFDVFRRLDPREIPSTLSQGFGADKALAILPSTAQDEIINAYRQLINNWQQRQRVQIEVVLDSEIDQLPHDKAIWLFGWNNQFQHLVSDQIKAYGSIIDSDQVIINDASYTRDKHSVLITSRHPQNPAQTILWLSSDNLAALPGLARKLPHYGKYSYLAFSGDEPENVGKGQWPVLNSPLVKTFGNKTHTPQKNQARQALATLAPVFSEQRMMTDIDYLANSQLNGRGLGSPELDKAANHIASEFKKAGLKTYDEDYFQQWQTDIDKLGKNITLKNVIGILPGSNPDYAGQSVVIAAHYDHLGLGWPDVRQGNEGKIHHGADDNASGVAVMLELARILGKSWKPERSIVFVAFTAEEAGLLGSSYYVNNSENYPIKKAMAILNLDAVGRLGDNDISVFGADSASEWVHIFRGVGFVTGIKTNINNRPFGASDHVNFHEMGVPGVQFFSGVHLDYHRPGDTADKIDSAGLVKIASVVRETLEYLAKRPESLTTQLGKIKLPDGSQVKRQGRKISIGTVPDFDYADNGVLLSDVVADSPAAKAGLATGDILQGINGVVIEDLPAYAKVLRNTEVGDILLVEYLRDGTTHQVKIVAEKR